MITDLNVQHELLKTALEATDNYLFIEKRAKAAGKATNHMVHDFTYELSRAHDALQALGVLDQHQEYMMNHIKEISKLAGQSEQDLVDQPYSHVPSSDVGDVEESVKLPTPSAEKKNNMRGYPKYKKQNAAQEKTFESNVKSFRDFMSEEKKNSDEDISEEEINKLVDSLTWEDIVDLYDDVELIYNKEDDEPEGEDEKELKEDFLNEKLSIQARLKKRQAFARMRSKRNVARNIKLRRPSSIDVLKKRAALAARRAVYKRLLRNRDKSTLSAVEKDRVEQQVSRMKYIQSAIATKMLPKMRSIEQKRIANYRTKK